MNPVRDSPPEADVSAPGGIISNGMYKTGGFNGVKKAGVHTNATSYYLFGVLIGFLLIFFYIWQRIQITNLDYEIVQLKKTTRAAENTNKLLKVQFYEHTSLARVAQRARKELQMVVPYESKDLIFIKEDFSHNSPPGRVRNFWSGFLIKLRLLQKVEDREE